MLSLLSSARNRWLLGIAVVVVGAGVATKDVISYPTECVPGYPAEIGPLQKT